MKTKNDQNFDNLSDRFRKNIYNTPKGQIRLNILWRDLLEKIPEIETGGLSILDAGAGQGNFALQLAQKNHQIKTRLAFLKLKTWCFLDRLCLCF